MASRKTDGDCEVWGVGAGAPDVGRLASGTWQVEGGDFTPRRP
ncbi:hypothetical protein [Zhongshania sp.]|nr:hypothetical protein [Zhongshania sp.]